MLGVVGRERPCGGMAKIVSCQGISRSGKSPKASTSGKIQASARTGSQLIRCALTAEARGVTVSCQQRAQHWGGRMHTKETCIQKYIECKLSNNGGIPEYREFLKYAGINKRDLIRLFGAAAYTKLQEEAGDTPNRLQLQRTPIATIMRQYGELVAEVGAVPPYAEWDMRGLRPTADGLSKSHNLKWSDLPARFVEWAKANSVPGFDRAIGILTNSSKAITDKSKNEDSDYLQLISDVRAWTPARRRNSEAEYKIELRKHLESIKYALNEEYGESLYDLLVERKYAIELKKDPNLSEYDRLFGQLARHLQHQHKVIILILEATRGDNYDNFTMLVDRYLNVGKNSVEIIKK